MQIEDGNVLHIKGEGGKEEQHNGGWVSWVSGVIMFFDKQWCDYVGGDLCGGFWLI